LPSGGSSLNEIATETTDEFKKGSQPTSFERFKMTSSGAYSLNCNKHNQHKLLHRGCASDATNLTTAKPNYQVCVCCILQQF
jgi:hypothetical protein